MAEEPCSGWEPSVSLCENWSAASDAVKAYALEQATLVLWAATGRRFGLCAVTVRPCSPPDPLLYRTYPVPPAGGYWGGTSIVGGVWYSCGCTAGCACSPSEIVLPGPVAAVVSAVQDGVTIDPSGYRLDPGGRLVRLNGQVWPASQDLTVAATEPNTFAITYSRGVPVPVALNNAAGVYACELAAALTGGECRLPDRIQTISRQGVTVDLVGPDDYLDKGRTGLADVDQVIVALNPRGLAAPPRVLTLDTPSFR